MVQPDFIASKFGSLSLAVLLMATIAHADERPTMKREASPAAVIQWFKQSNARVLTFVGYSGAGYEDAAAMLAAANKVLDQFDPATTIVNIGATAEGIGAVYEIAKRRGFRTSGIVSTQARKSGAALSPFVDTIFFVPDATWGGVQASTAKLSPTSAAMVGSSDVMVAIGGGEIGRDEWFAAKRAGKDVRFIPADMNHQAAMTKAAKNGKPAPTDFKGAIPAALAGNIAAPSK